ncbi:MAG: hypothetical protein U5K53_08290 [Halanaerobiales bacterium]|nr:hypothetical protein [Halanaerobiales bacterium]
MNFNQYNWKGNNIKKIFFVSLVLILTFAFTPLLSAQQINVNEYDLNLTDNQKELLQKEVEKLDVNNEDITVENINETLRQLENRNLNEYIDFNEDSISYRFYREKTRWACPLDDVDIFKNTRILF